MYVRIRPALVGSVAAVTINAFAAAAVASAAPAPGGIPVRVIRNQLEYCGVICPFVVQGAVTGPALAATGPIITNDLSLVLPKAQNALEVSTVELINVGFATRDPGELVRAIGGARTNIAAALDQRIGDPVGPTGAVNLPQVVAVEAVNVGSAVAFQATEAGLLDVVKSADDTAQTLARTGNVVAAASVGARSTANALGAARRTVTDSVNTAASHIRSSLHNPFPTAGGRSAQESATNSHVPAGRRIVDRIVHRAMNAVHTRETAD